MSASGLPIATTDSPISKSGFGFSVAATRSCALIFTKARSRRKSRATTRPGVRRPVERPTTMLFTPVTRWLLVKM